MQAQLDSTERLPWKKPTLEARDDFLHRMQKLATTYEKVGRENIVHTELDVSVNEDEEH